MIEVSQIPLQDLEVDSWYIGRGRRANLGLWNGDSFAVLVNRCGSWAGSSYYTRESSPCVKYENYYIAELSSELLKSDFYPFSCGTFQPFLKVDFGQTIEEIENSTDAMYGYAKKIRFG